MHLVNQPATIEADSDQLANVIMNLATNASEAMPNGGQLRISTTKVMLGKDFCKGHIDARPGPCVLLTLTDTGRGMDEAILSRMFDPFFTTKERGTARGTGLDLSVARGIVRQPGGFITCESVLGKGTTFRVYFPEVGTPAGSKMIENKTESSMSTKTILIVEDNTLISGLEETAFNAAGHKTIVASTGKDAVITFGERHDEISVVILDIIMPGMNGKECLMELLKIDPLVKVVVLTGCDPKAELSLAVKPYVKSFLPKPCKMRQLVDVIQSVMEG